ncbi:MAG TPA: tRNA (adenosine(37)-N6)-dimethylallyltransferase MiaA [Candidatus Hydrogenedentes bacterium]|nr:tRNA (adenosine(37)-N6)-dimethylallyltransferase MiaA [Candidatus Hydrogenedentota bacterium]
MLVKTDPIRTNGGPTPPQLIALVGPTASGKTALAIEIAARLDTEIISADSMQFYRGMEIGTGAPEAQQLARVQHHFVGFIEPDAPFSAGAFERDARAIVDRLNRRGRPAVVVGGSGLYISALIDGLFPGPGKDAEIRARLQEEAETAGVRALYARLREVDAGYADTIQCNDLRRIVRGIEVYEQTGTPLSTLHREHREEAVALDAVQFALDWPRDQLYARIDRRVDAMIQAGFLDEVQRLLDNGYGPHIERLRSLGYREMAAYLRRECALEEATERMKRNTRRYAKRQLTWFRSDSRIQWIPAAGHSAEDLAETILNRF